MMLHKRKRSKAMNSDEYATMWDLFNALCREYDLRPNLDVSANFENTKCMYYITKEIDALTVDWVIAQDKVVIGKNGTPFLSHGRYAKAVVWCNPPHNKKKVNGKWVSQTELFVRKAQEQWEKHNINIMMIIPANAVCTKYAEECIEGKAEIHPIYGRPRFEVNGKPAKDSARNSYFCVIWRKRIEYICVCGGSGCPACK